MEAVEAREFFFCVSQKGRYSKRRPRSRASIAHCPNNTHSHQNVYIQLSFCNAFHCITLMFFRLLLSAAWKQMNHKITKKILSHREWNRASLEILMLKTIVQHCFFPKVLALSAELEKNILFLEEQKKKMKHMGLLFAVLHFKISYRHYILF